MTWNCNTTDSRAFDAAIDRLDTATRAPWQIHAHQCDACQRHVERMGMLLQQRRGQEPPENLLAETLAALAPEIERASLKAKRKSARGIMPALFGVAGSAVAAVALVAAIGLVGPNGSVGHLVRVSNSTALAEDESTLESLLTGISVGDQLSADGASVLEFSLDGNDLVLHRDSRLTISKASQEQTLLTLETGALTVRARKQTSTGVLMIEAPFGRVTVRGTLFRVNANDGQVWTAEGVVDVQPHGTNEKVELRAGDVFDRRHGRRRRAGDDLNTVFRTPWWRAHKNTPDRYGWIRVSCQAHKAQIQSVMLGGEEIGTAPQILRWPTGKVDYVVTSREQEARGVLDIQPGVTAEIRCEHLLSKAAVEDADDDQLGKDDLGPALDHDRVVDPVPVTHPQRRRLPKRVPKVISDALQSARCNDAHDMVTKLTALAPADRSETLTLIAECHLALAEPRRALAIYRKVDRDLRHTPAAEAALFEIGRLSEELGEHKRAKNAFRNYVKRHTGGPLHADALFRLCALEIGDRQFDAAKTCLQRYREKHRDGERVAESFALEAKLEKEIDKNWEKAAALYHRAYELESGARAERAAYGWVVCLGAIDAPAAAKAAQEYLKHFPDGVHAQEVRAWVR